MGTKREARGRINDLAPVKRPKRDHGGLVNRANEAVTHPVLSQYYASVSTLREYVLSRLPSTSRIRRNKVRRVGRGPGPLTERETRLSHLLDTTWVGAPEISREQLDDRWNGRVPYSQTNEESNVTLSDVLGNSTFSQAEVRCVGVFDGF